MSALIGIRDGGKTQINYNGRIYEAEALIFRVSLHEARPFDFVGYCKPYLKDSIIKYLKKIYFPRPAPPEIDTTQHRPKIDQAEFVEALEDEFLNPYLLSGDELARTEAMAKRGEHLF